MLCAGSMKALKAVFILVHYSASFGFGESRFDDNVRESAHMFSVQLCLSWVLSIRQHGGFLSNIQYIAQIQIRHIWRALSDVRCHSVLSIPRSIGTKRNWLCSPLTCPGQYMLWAWDCDLKDFLKASKYDSRAWVDSSQTQFEAYSQLHYPKEFGW